MIDSREAKIFSIFNIDFLLQMRLEPLNKLSVMLGLIALAYAAYLAMKWNAISRQQNVPTGWSSHNLDQVPDFASFVTSMPSKIFAIALFAFIISVYGIYKLFADFEPINTVHFWSKQVDDSRAALHRPSFVIIGNRALYLNQGIAKYS
ncbi:hypothetical protein ACOME3_010323 [Neoechinorhynchus agilis]